MFIEARTSEDDDSKALGLFPDNRFDPRIDINLDSLPGRSHPSLPRGSAGWCSVCVSRYNFGIGKGRPWVEQDVVLLTYPVS